jgi:hypothetical protein
MLPKFAINQQIIMVAVDGFQTGADAMQPVQFLPS